jgi:hypothetical protein
MQTEFQPTTWQACWRIVVEGQAPADADPSHYKVYTRDRQKHVKRRQL